MMMSCIDQSVCTFDQDNEINTPHIEDPVPNVPTTLIGNLCDDVTFVQVSKGILDICINW